VHYELLEGRLADVLHFLVQIDDGAQLPILFCCHPEQLSPIFGPVSLLRFHSRCLWVSHDL
jgi:hypothetical protein